jgi:hypothetical protein
MQNTVKILVIVGPEASIKAPEVHFYYQNENTYQVTTQKLSHGITGASYDMVLIDECSRDKEGKYGIGKGVQI